MRVDEKAICLDSYSSRSPWMTSEIVLLQAYETLCNRMTMKIWWLLDRKDIRFTLQPCVDAALYGEILVQDAWKDCPGVNISSYLRRHLGVY